MNLERILTVIKEPHLSEKSTMLMHKQQQFVFKVANNATKAEIKSAVEHLFEVKVAAVSVVNLKGKRKRFRQLAGKRNNIKKAIVSLEEGYNIDFTVA